ncbi:MAG TPA: FTR1 family protein [Thermodesulfobacteriota bacterium]|nr:FTR1 family protein [Thermodesulfobacteriota bacterium]
MFASFIITFREVLEAALVVVIVLAYLKRTGQTRYYKNVWTGISTGVLLSILLAFFFNMVYGGLAGRTEEIFEGATMLVAAGLLTWMILWMAMQKNIAGKLETEIDRRIGEGHALGISALVATAVLREGVEMVIFMQAARFAGSADLLGAVSGAALATSLGYLLFMGSRRIRVKTFFQVTSIILVLFAAGLVSHGIHEFEEAGILPSIVKPLYDITWFLSKEGPLGGILNALFGYTGRPSLMEMSGYTAYLLLILVFLSQIRRLQTGKAGVPGCAKTLKG